MGKQLALALALLFCAAGVSAQILPPILYGNARTLTLTLTATTASSSQSVTIQQLTLSVDTIISWGDTQTTALSAGTTSTISHTYASAGTYSISVPRARQITTIDLRDAKLGGLNTAQLHDSNISWFYVIAITGSTIRSADMAAWRPTTWDLYSMPTGGTYSIASADMAAWTTTATVYSPSMPSGTWNVSGSFATLAALRDLELQGNGLSQAQVDAVLAGIWAGKANYTYATPALNIGGSNAAPSGTYSSTCPPTTGKAYAYELANGVCSTSGPHWAITYTP